MRELHYAYNWMTAAFVPGAAQLERYHASEAERIRILDGEPPPDTSAELERLTAEMEARRKTVAKGKKRIGDMSVGTTFKDNDSSLDKHVYTIIRIDKKSFYYSFAPFGILNGVEYDCQYGTSYACSTPEIISEPTPEVGDTVQCLDDKDWDDKNLRPAKLFIFNDKTSVFTSEKWPIGSLASIDMHWHPVRSLRIIKKKGT